MPSTKAIKRRIASVKSTRHIMKAMNLVATSKLQKCKERLDAILPLFEETKRVMSGVGNGVKNYEGAPNDFINAREIRNTAYVVITSDRGLCGGYNVNVSKEAFAFINEKKNEKIIAIGTKGWEFFRKRGKNVIQRFAGVSDATLYEDAEKIGKLLTSMYMSEEVDEVYLVYTHFESMLSHVPRVVKILPVGGEPDSENDSGAMEMEYEPDINTFLEHAMPMYFNVVLYGAMAEAAVCEQASRMVSMDAATNNANEIIDDLTLEYNRERQSIITQELNEIIGGSSAL